MSRNGTQIFFLQLIAFLLISSSTLKNPGWIGRGGCWDFSEDIIKAQALIGHNKAYYELKDFSAFVYAVRCRKLSENGPFGLLFRYDESRDMGYCFQYWPLGGYRISIINGGQNRVILIKAHKTPFRYQGLDVWNTIKIVMKGDELNIFINDFLVETIFDSTCRSGKLGLYMHGDPRQRAQFEILKMDRLP